MLRLLAHSYDQVQPDGSYRERGHGDEFEPVSDAERDRLVGLGVAIDPQKANELERERAKAEAKRLNDEAAALTARAKQLDAEQPAPTSASSSAQPASASAGPASPASS